MGDVAKKAVLTGFGDAVAHERVDCAWQTVQAQLEQGPGNLAVFTHGLVCYSLASRRLRLPDGVAAPMGFGNTSLTVIDPEPPWAVRLLACCEHVEGTAAEAGRQPSGI